MDLETITLECWIYGEEVYRCFHVTIANTGTVENLKEAIKTKKSTSFRDVDAEYFDLYSIANTTSEDDLAKELGLWTPEGKEHLRLRTKASELADSLIIIDGPRSLECWVYGEDVDVRFEVTIANTGTVKDLKEAIKTKKSTSFHDVDAEYLDLYSIVNTTSEDDLEKELGLWTPEGKTRLRLRKKASELAGSLIIIDGPGSFASREITLNCWVHGSTLDCVFPVEISRTKLVGILKKVIKSESDIEAKALNFKLYRVSLPFDDSIQETIQNLNLHEGDVLQAVKRVSYYFPDTPLHEHIHIVIKAPQPTHGPAVIPPVLLPFRHPRLKYINSWNSKEKMSPSIQGLPSKFNHLQSTDAKIPWARPSAATSIPVTLLHHIFGQFAEDCDSYEPTAEDNAFALDLSSKMSNFFKDEAQRQDAILETFRRYNLGMVASSFSGYHTDGDLHVNGLRYVILEVKNEIGSSGAEPYCQGVSYYTEATKEAVQKALEKHESEFGFPCLIVTHFGPQLSFSGAVWADQPNYEVLSTTLPLFYHPTHAALRRSTARHLGAFKKACQNLKELYEGFNADPAAFRDLQPIFPHPRFYTELDGVKKRHFRYIRALPDSKLLFVAETDTNERVCIKFVQAYSKEVHQHCADFSPRLRAYDNVGGWKMVVMDFLEDYSCLHRMMNDLDWEQRDRLTRELRSSLTALHQKNFVHGDVRNANVMVKLDPFGWKLVDFDWSGKIGKARYPMNVNRGPGLSRPKGAIDGALILANHDIDMLGFLFSK